MAQGQTVTLLRQASLEDVHEEIFVKQHSLDAWTIVGCFSCNSLARAAAPFPAGRWTKAECKIRWQHRGFSEPVEKELRGRRVNYEGEEVGTRRPLSLEQVLPALPPKDCGGSIDLARFLSASSCAFLRDPMKHLVEDTGQPLPRLQGKVHVRDGGLDSIANELVHRGVCEWIPYEKLFWFTGDRKYSMRSLGPRRTGEALHQLADDACVDAHVV